MKKRLLVLFTVFIIVLVPLLLSCSFDFLKRGDKGDDSNGDNNGEYSGVYETNDYKLYFFTISEGECSVVVEIKPSVKNASVTIPDNAPNGDVVKNVIGGKFDVGANLPRIMTVEQGDEIFARMEANAAGDNNVLFALKKIQSFYAKYDTSTTLSEVMAGIIEQYPIAEITPVYVLDAEISQGDKQRLSEYLESYASYTKEACYNDIQEMNALIKESGKKMDPIIAVSEPDQLGSLEISDGVQMIGRGAFENATALASVSLGSGLKKIDDNAFAKCSSLTKITFPSSLVAVGTDAFSECNAIAEVNAQSMDSWCNITFENEYSNPTVYAGDIKCNGQPVTSVTVPSGIQKISYCAFYNCKSLKSITFSEGISTIGGHAFYNCSSLETISLPDSMRLINVEAFKGCEAIKTVNISSMDSWCKIDFYGEYANPTVYARDLTLNGEVVTNVVVPDGISKISGYAFYNCTSLESISFPASITYIGSDAFKGCYALKAVNISGLTDWFNIDFANGYSNPVYYSSAIKVNGNAVVDLVIPESVTKIKPYAFYGCSSINSISFHDGITEMGEFAFARCYGIQSIRIPKGVTTISGGLFVDCYNLREVILHDNVISMESATYYYDDGDSNIKHREAFPFYGCSIRYNIYRNICYLGTDTNPYYMAYYAELDENTKRIGISKDTKIVIVDNFDIYALQTGYDGFEVIFEDTQGWSVVGDGYSYTVFTEEIAYKDTAVYALLYNQGIWVKNYINPNE